MKYSEAVAQAIDQSMASDENVIILGLGVPDPSGIFGTTLGLQEKYGPARVMDLPTSENGMTGVTVGCALTGIRPIITHHRVDFSLLAMEQICNQAAKWHYTFGGDGIPLVIRMIIGRGWGQGPQHSQSLHALFGHFPGIKVVMPSTPYDVKGLFISAVEDNNPVIFIEHRWLHYTFGEVPEEMYRVPIGKAKVVREGKDVSVVANSHAVIEALKCASVLEKSGIDVEVVDLRTLRPLDSETIVNSVKKTGHLLTIDTAWSTNGTNAELLALVAESALSALKQPPIRLGLKDCPTPASPPLAHFYYPNAEDLVRSICETLGKPLDDVDVNALKPEYVDIPDKNFTGPF